jgi:hypothetical protein
MGYDQALYDGDIVEAGAKVATVGLLPGSHRSPTLPVS